MNDDENIRACVKYPEGFQGLINNYECLWVSYHGLLPDKIHKKLMKLDQTPHNKDLTTRSG